MVGFGDGLDDGQAEAESPGLPALARLGAGEPVEDPLQVGRRDAGARIGHGQDDVPILAAGADVDAVGRPGVRDGVLQQCVEGQRQPVAVTVTGAAADPWSRSATRVQWPPC